MTKSEALEMLKTAPATSKISKLNSSLTEKQVVEIMIKSMEEGREELSALAEKRVWQAYKNQRRPKYEQSSAPSARWGWGIIMDKKCQQQGPIRPE